jgi:hypothetical protein
MPAAGALPAVRASVQRAVSAATLELFAGSARAGVVAPDLVGRTTVGSICEGPTRYCASIWSEVAVDIDKPSCHAGDQFLAPLLILGFLVRTHLGINVMLMGKSEDRNQRSAVFLAG